MSFHKSLEHKYAPVPEDRRIQTLPFLLASTESILPVIDMLGPNAFAFVKSDVNGNMKRVRKRYDEDPEKFSTLADIIEIDVKENKGLKSNSTTEALLWLSRALNFICTILKNVIEGNVKDNSIIPALSTAYKATLEGYHSWFVRKAVELAFHAAPYYTDLISKLSNGESQEVVLKDIREYDTCLQEHVSAIQELFIANGLDPKK
ncbi:glycolipid transfer protein-like [Patiria miniata]|uniref:Glycolipid transfer protein domain-containing protein n=1 Tax=Patiria miniata TaxID=46514 RepID=A0A913ZRN4_PATMI|nr:glycolipid transfer protein-like [Patiria miniata]